jgi:arabinan endo-1,5-alpha-L-arabinosidase
MLTRALIVLLTVTLAASATPMAQASPGDRVRPTDPIAHDPTMAKEGAYHYVIITGDAQRPNTYLPIKRSKDLVHWEEVGSVFAALPAWVIQELGTTPADAWAPDLARIGGRWALYYSASRFGTQNSVIGLVTTPTLDPASPDYRWTDQGMVLRSTPGADDFNAIDPEFVADTDGSAWLAFGSFWGGIKMRRLDPATGKLSTSDTAVRSLSSRVAPDAEEGPSIIRHGRYYYLFLSFDFCCRGVEADYRMVVGRATSVTGPYVDRGGVPLTEGGGTEILRGYNEFVGTGGGDAVSTRNGTYLVNHYYDATDGGAPRLNVRPVSWRDDWPTVGDPLNPSRSVGHGDAYVRLVERTTGRPVVNVGCGYEGADLALGDPDNPGDPCQQWQYGYRGNGTSSLLNRYSNKIAEIAACDNRDGGRVAQWGWIGFLPNNDCQRWRSQPGANGWTRIQSVLTGSRVLDVARCAGGPNDAIVVNSRSDASCQEFRFQPIGPVLLVDAQDADSQDTDSQDARSRDADSQDARSRDAGSQDGRSSRRTWRFAWAGGAEYTITDTANGRPFGGAPGRWTLVPRTDGMWTLARVGTPITKTVKVLIP